MSKASDTRNFVIAGHSGSGKTTLCDLLLYKGKAVPRQGSVDTKTSISDYTPEEQEKHSSIYSAILNCQWQNTDLFFVDTPGYGEFVGEYAAAVQAADAALVILDAVDGPQIGTARAWKMSRLQGIARFGLINRLDKERADFEATLEKMRHNHGRNVVIPLTWPIGKEGNFKSVIHVLTEQNLPADIKEQVTECRSLWMDAIAETDEDLMMRYLDGQTLTPAEIETGLKAAIASGKVIPVFAGSSTKDVGITELMDYMVKLFPDPLSAARKFVNNKGDAITVSETGPAIGLVFKSVDDPFSGHLAFVRVVTGTFKGDVDVSNVSRNAKERFGHLLLINGKNQTAVETAGPGTIFAMAKLKDTHTGDTLSSAADTAPLKALEFPGAVMAYAVTAAKSGEDEKIAAALHKIAECDPTVRLKRNDETHEFILYGMGDQHLAYVGKRLREYYKAEAVFNTPKIAYRETITANGEGDYRHKKQTGGAGQFAEVHLRIFPNEGGVEFHNDVVGGTIPKNFIPAVEKGIMEMTTKGPLVGCLVERVKVSVYDGKYHPVDSNEMAFKIAARMAFKEAMSKAKPVLLEPIMRVDIHIPDAYTGDVSGDLNHKRGRITGMSAEEGMEVVQAEVPLAEMHKYATELRSMTQGRGSFEMVFARYEQVPSQLASEITAKHQAETAHHAEE